MTATDADRNAYADAGDYDALALFTADPLDTVDDVTAGGGSPVAVTMGLVGDPGPDPARHPAVVGRRYSSAAGFTLTESATWLGALVGGEVRRSVRLRTPIGPGVYPLVFAVTVS